MAIWHWLVSSDKYGRWSSTIPYSNSMKYTFHVQKLEIGVELRCKKFPSYLDCNVNFVRQLSQGAFLDNTLCNMKLFGIKWRHNGLDAISNHQPYHCLLTVYSGGDQRKHQSSASLAFVRGIHRWPLNSSHKCPVTLKMFPFDDVIMIISKAHRSMNG